MPISATTCGQLLPILSVFLLVFLVNGRAVSHRYRIGWAYVAGFTAGVYASLLGITITAIGVLIGGLNIVGDIGVWITTVASLVALFVFATLLATSSYDRDLAIAQDGRTAPSPAGALLRAGLTARAPWDRDLSPERSNRDRPAR